MAMIGSRGRGTAAAVAVLLALAVLPTTSVATVSDPTYGPHTGQYGLHWLLGSREYPTFTCNYDQSGLLRQIKIRRPIVFAVDRRAGSTDHQQVGWRYTIEHEAGDGASVYTNWPDEAASTIIKAFATDLDPAPFRPRKFTFQHTNTDGQHFLYRVSYTLFWYLNGHVDGKAVDVGPFAETDQQGGMGGVTPLQNPECRAQL
jgi:hypothetical protein